MPTPPFNIADFKDTQSYTIELAEYQRAIIEIALRHVPFDAIKHIELPSHEDGHAETVLNLKEMFEELPQSEAETPGVLHGFCL